MADTQLSAPVGRGVSDTGRKAVNKREDVRKVFELFNAIDTKDGGRKQNPLTPGDVVTDELHKQIVAFQKHHFSGWSDGVIDHDHRRTLKKLGGLANATPGPPDKDDDDLPNTEPYTKIHADLKTLLRRSYRERDDKNENLRYGFDADVHEKSPQSRQTFKQVVDRLMARSDWKVLDEMRVRCEAKVAGLWGKIRWLSWFYDYTSSRGIWCCLYPSQIVAAHELLRQSGNFCADMFVGQSMHQKAPDSSALPTQCFRQLGVLEKEGLHVCMIVTSAKGSAFGEWHNIHVDPHQIGGDKGKKCTCWYAKTKSHFKDVGRWCVEQVIGKFKDDPRVKAALTLLGIDPTQAVYDKLMEIVGDYDTLVDMADHPENYDKTLDPRVHAKIAFAKLYKSLYVEHMPPQFQT